VTSDIDWTASDLRRSLGRSGKGSTMTLMEDAFLPGLDGEQVRGGGGVQDGHAELGGGGGGRLTRERDQ
jgi:hypothetical protein